MLRERGIGGSSLDTPGAGMLYAEFVVITVLLGVALAFALTGAVRWRSRAARIEAEAEARSGTTSNVAS